MIPIFILPFPFNTVLYLEIRYSNGPTGVDRPKGLTMQPGVEGVCQTWYHVPHDKCGLGRILRECPSLNFLEIPSSGFPEEHRLLTSKPTEYPPRPLSRQIHWAQANPKSGSLGSSRIILSARLCFDGLRFPGNMTCGCPTQCKPRLPLCPSASHPESNGYVFLRRFQSQITLVVISITTSGNKPDRFE